MLTLRVFHAPERKICTGDGHDATSISLICVFLRISFLSARVGDGKLPDNEIFYHALQNCGGTSTCGVDDASLFDVVIL